MSAVVIGNTLKEARVKKSLSLDEVHAKIKIHPHVLQLLEEGKFDKLPTPLFAKSFLRSYADFLGINSSEIVDAYDKESESKREPDQVLFIKTVDEKNKDTHAGKNLMLIAVIAAGILVGSLLLSFAVKHVPGWVQKIKFPETKTWFAGKAGSAAAKVKAPVKDLTPNAIKQSGQQSPKKEAKKSDEWVRSLDQGNFPKISQKTLLELRLRALDIVWIRVTSDGKEVYQGMLGRNTVETWTAKDQLELWTGNASNMFLSVNRYSLGSPGRGMIRKMIITREGVRIPSAENR